ncbi:hypothetical protein I5398_23425 [Citrobacter freundii]|nr:hypothetical protein [Citrobacter freundii]
MTVYEMEGFLRGKCLPGDMMVNEGNAQYLVRKFSELQSQNADLAVQLANAESKCRELAAQEANGRFPLPKDSPQGWKIDPEFISKIQDAIGYDEECQCWEGSPSMEMVEAVLIAVAAIKMDERGE